MIDIHDSYLLSESICNKIIEEYLDKVSEIKTSRRKQKNYHEINPNSWIYREIQKLIKQNLGDDYNLIERVTILKYEVGDYFKEHTDGEWNSKLNRELPPTHFYGGIELCDKSEYDGGEFFIEGIDVEYRKGRMFTHGFSTTHGVRPVTRGTRWSIHFVVDKKIKKSII